MSFTFDLASAFLHHANFPSGMNKVSEFFNVSLSSVGLAWYPFCITDPTVAVFDVVRHHGYSALYRVLAIL